MIPFEEAIEIILGASKPFGREEVELNYSLGRVLLEKIAADRDMPPFHRVTMDGIALLHKSFAKTRTFRIAGLAAAGSPQLTLQNDDDCIEVMTGAILPSNTDSVIRYEDLAIEDGQATVNLIEIKQGQNVHKQGEDRQKGSVVVKSGAVIGTPEIGVAASVGKQRLLVNKLPRVAIISTGDELVEVDQLPEPYQIRKSNVHQTRASLQHMGIDADLFHLNDEYEQILATLKQYLNKYDALLLSGGVSKGKFDFLPKAFDELGVKKHFHRVMQRPGKPFWFGTYNETCTIFAFPGNPVSSFMCFHRYFIPWLNRSMGKPDPEYPYAILMEDVSFKPDLTYFLEVKISYGESGNILAKPIFGHGSGDFANLVDADAFIQLPRGKDTYPAGEAYPVIFFRN